MYRIVTDDEAIEQITALPDDALVLYAEVLDLLQIAPHEGDPYNAVHPDRPMRNRVFGPAGEGMVTYLLLEDRREVHVLLVRWLPLGT